MAQQGNGSGERQHYLIASSGLGELGSVDSPFKNGFDHGAPARGTLLDSQRACSKGGKVNHGDADDYK